MGAPGAKPCGLGKRCAIQLLCLSGGEVQRCSPCGCRRPPRHPLNRPATRARAPSRRGLRRLPNPAPCQSLALRKLRHAAPGPPASIRRIDSAAAGNRAPTHELDRRPRHAHHAGRGGRRLLARAIDRRVRAPLTDPGRPRASGRAMARTSTRFSFSEVVWPPILSYRAIDGGPAPKGSPGTTDESPWM